MKEEKKQTIKHTINASISFAALIVLAWLTGNIGANFLEKSAYTAAAIVMTPMIYIGLYFTVMSFTKCIKELTEDDQEGCQKCEVTVEQ